MNTRELTAGEKCKKKRYIDKNTDSDFGPQNTLIDHQHLNHQCLLENFCLPVLILEPANQDIEIVFEGS